MLATPVVPAGVGLLILDVWGGVKGEEYLPVATGPREPRPVLSGTPRWLARSRRKSAGGQVTRPSEGTSQLALLRDL